MTRLSEAAEGGAAPSDIRHVALFTGVQLDVIAQPHLPGHGHVEPAEEVRKRILKRQRDGQAAHPQCREDRRDYVQEGAEDQQNAEDHTASWARF